MPLDKESRHKRSFKKWIPLAVLVLGLCAFFYFDLGRYLSFEALREHREALIQWKDAHLVAAIASFMGAYVLAVALSIPGAVFITLLGGFLFGPILGTLLVVTSATAGACLIFMAVKTSLGAWLRDKASAWFEKMEAGFQKNSFHYLLFIRLVPLFPFWAVNIIPALLNMPLKSYALATFMGIIPGSFVYVLVGNGLGTVLDKNETPDLSILFEPQVLIPILGLAVLSLTPILYKRYKKTP